MIRQFSRVAAPFCLLAILLLAAVPAQAQQAQAQDEARQTIQHLSDALLGVMRQADKLGFQGRAEALRPVIESSYDIPVMTRGALGPSAAKLGEADFAMLADAFTRYTVATYAAEFDGYDGEHFEVDPPRPSVEGAVIVPSRIVPKQGSPSEIDYLLRQEQGHWRIVDVLLDGSVSQVAVRRSEFSAIFRRDGAQGLANLMNQKTAALAQPQ